MGKGANTSYTPRNDELTSPENQRRGRLCADRVLIDVLKMKSLLKLLLILCVLIAGIYAATPLWLPYIIARQLPPGWQLEQLEAGYPGIHAINIKTLRVKGELRTTGMALAVADIRFSYQGLKTAIGSVSLDVFMRATEDSAVTLTLDDLSLPVAKLTGKLPGLSISQLRVVVHQAGNFESGNVDATAPLVLDFHEIKLIPRADNSFHLDTDVTIEGEGSSEINAQVDVDVSTNSIKARLRIPAATSSPPWLTVSLEQQDHVLETTTQIYAAFDAEAADLEWLDSLLVRSSGGMLTHMRGKLELLADFAGKERQVIEHLSLAAGQLQTGSGGETLILDADLLVSRAGEKITATLSKPAEIRYQDEAGRMNDLLAGLVPGLQRSSRPVATALAEFDAGSRFIIQTGADPSMEFSGTMKLGIASAEEIISLHATDLQIETGDFSSLESSTATGLVTLNWVTSAPFTYTSDGLYLEADKLSFSSTGDLHIAGQNVVFRQTDNFDMQVENLQIKRQAGENRVELNSERYAMQGRLDVDLSMSVPGVPVNFYFDGPVTAVHARVRLSGDERSHPVTIMSDELSATANLTSRDGSLVSTGSSTFTGAHISPPDVSAATIDVSWHELDLLKLTGKLGTKTQGFTAEADGETWKDLDFNIKYTLLGNAGIKGSGTLQLAAGPDLPIKFSGNTQAARWHITLPATTIKLAQLGSLLRVAHVELPASVKLTGGYIDIQGAVAVAGEITANMTISGHEMGGSMQASSIRNASFSFSTRYDNTLSASGPLLIETLTLAGGVDVTNIRADLNIDNTDTFGLKNLYAEVFDGQLNLGSLQFSENRIADTSLELTHISLGRLLAVADIDGLDGSGILDIMLPAGSDETGIYIKNGTFSSTGPGRLAYTREGLAGSNIGMQALENFQYQELSGTVNYQPDGAYRIALHLEGNNPDLYGGHPIVFNLNINGFLPDAFEALFVTGSFEESILNQIRAK